MKSKIAEEAVARMRKDALEPTFDDCITLNALGLRVERDGGEFSLGVMPRVAFLGDYIFTEPTVGKWMWLDAARQVAGGDYLTALFLTAYALNTPAAELPRLGGLFTAAKLARCVRKFRDEVLVNFSISEIEAAVDIALNGAEADADVRPEPTLQEKEARQKCREIPSAASSSARALVAYAAGLGIDADTAKLYTIPALDRMITIAAMLKGSSALEGNSGRATADFYRTVDAVRARLIKEKENSNGIA